MKTSILVTVIISALLAFNSVTQALIMDWVTVGNAGNAADSTGHGGVSGVYQIGKYEVTAGQYTEFLNAVAATDTYGLYTYTGSSSYGCQITRQGSSGSYTYDFSGRPSGTEADWANRPVNYVNWYSSLRFANWLHNGQGTGDTEDGAYDMSLGSSVVRKAGAQVWLPSEDEWYKAAYHKNDGVTGNYFEFPTSSDSVPGRDMTESTNAGNNANYYDNGWLIGSPYYRTEVGEFDLSDSPYGTFDMGGNVLEWNETLVTGSSRGCRGGSFDSLNVGSSARPGVTPDGNFYVMGFRVASVPEPLAPPVADANGPYTLYAGDTLTLDASGSTDDANDITSYVWDLDDDGVFETDAGTEAVIDVSYAYLESLGLGIGVDYNIHLKVTDGDEQADTDTTTLTIEPALVIAVDIKPTSCPNPFNVNSKGVLPVAIPGSETVDVNDIDIDSIQLAGVSPIRYNYEDVATGLVDPDECECSTEGPDGYVDLTLKFESQAIADALGEAYDGEEFILYLTGYLYDGTPIEGSDCIIIRRKGRR